MISDLAQGLRSAAGIPFVDSRNLWFRTVMYQVVVNESVLREIVRRLVEAFDPDRIILFGSRARGDFQPDSDVDLLIVRDSNQPMYRRAAEAYRVLRGIPVPTDIIWRTPAEVEEWSNVRTYVTTRALREGRVLYEKRS